MPLSFHDLVVSLRRITDRIPNIMPGRGKDLGQKACV
jgi:hypothetical protein